VNGRKRHIFVDTLGLLWMVVVHVASIQDFDGGKLVLTKVQALKDAFPRLQVIWADSIYAALVSWVTALGCWVLEVVHRDKTTKGFVVLPHRWIVERTFSWFGHFHRLDKEHEELLEVSEAMCYWAMVHLMVRRLTHGQTVWHGP
jgi:putative transposase